MTNTQRQQTKTVLFSGFRIFVISMLIFLLITGFYESVKRAEIQSKQDSLSVDLQEFIDGTVGNRYTNLDAAADFKKRDIEIQQIKHLLESQQLQLNSLEEKLKTK